MRLPFTFPRPLRSVAIVTAVALTIGVALVGGEDDSEAAVATAAARAGDRAARVDLPEQPNRPKVYLAYHGSEPLLGNNDHLWPYVRANLDGFWGNPFSPIPDTKASLDRTIELTRKVQGRELIVEHPIADEGNGACEWFRNDWYQTETEKMAPDIRYERVAAAIYAGRNPNCWGANGGIWTALDVYRAQGYDTVYTLFQPQNLSTRVNSSSFPTMSPGSSGDIAYRNSGGVVIECPIDACLDPTFGAPFFQAVQDAHARGVPFVWFTGFHIGYGIGRSGWLHYIQRVYNALAFFGLWRAEDAIAIINYSGYRALPERNADGSPADTVTGILAWLLEQRPIKTLCTSAC